MKGKCQSVLPNTSGSTMLQKITQLKSVSFIISVSANLESGQAG